MVLNAITKPPPEDRTDSMILACGAVAWLENAAPEDVWITQSREAASEVSPNWANDH
jgi:hypothetical protein